jgi:gamma-tubulin complex component 5
MKEEPFEGEHWEGVFSSGVRVDGDTSLSSMSERDSGVEDELSHSGDSDESMTSLSSPPAHLGQVLPSPVPTRSEHFQGSSIESRQLMERLREKQTWREEWSMDVKWNRPFNTADPSTLAAAVSRIMEPRIGGRILTPKVSRYSTLRNVLSLRLIRLSMK